MLHNLIFIAWGYWVIQLDWGKEAEALLILIPGLGMTFLIYHYLIRRHAPLRFLFGLRAKRERVTA